MMISYGIRYYAIASLLYNRLDCVELWTHTRTVFSFALAKLNKQVCVSVRPCVCPSEAKNCKMRDSRFQSMSAVKCE